MSIDEDAAVADCFGQATDPGRENRDTVEVRL